MYYSVYKTTNMINGKIYIGCHKTENLDDGYIGSGKYLQYAIKKYGRENFKKEILAVFDNKEDMFEMESVLVEKNFISCDKNYNLKEGGLGGFDYLNSPEYNNPSHSFEHMQMMSKKGNDAKNKKCRELRNNKQWLDEFRIKLSNALKLYYASGGKGHFTDKRHTAETKMKMSKSQQGKHIGSKNSQFDTMWIYNETMRKSIKIKKNEFDNYERLGWLKGRKIKF